MRAEPDRAMLEGQSLSKVKFVCKNVGGVMHPHQAPLNPRVGAALYWWQGGVRMTPAGVSPLSKPCAARGSALLYVE